MLKKSVLFVFLLGTIGVFAQEKIAYLNCFEIIKIMPAYIQMEDSMQKTQTVMQNEMSILEEEYNKKYGAFMNEADNLVEVIKVKRMQEIKDLEERIGIFREQFQKQLKQMYEQLIAPIQQKIQEAMRVVSIEHNFTYILEEATLLHVSPSAINAAPFVKQKLGLK